MLSYLNIVPKETSNKVSLMALTIAVLITCLVCMQTTYKFWKKQFKHGKVEKKRNDLLTIISCVSWWL